MHDILTHPVTAVVVLLGLLVTVHELGHFLVGRWAGIAVETFSIGFGPRIFGFRSGGTDYRLSIIPLGGYVKFAGAHPAEDVPPGLTGKPFRDAPLSRRIAVVCAGPLANFLLAAVVFAVLGMTGIPHPPPYIGAVIPGSAADRAGFRHGDVLVKIEDRPIKTWRDLEEMISAAPGKTLAVQVARHGATVSLSLTPAPTPSQDAAGRATTVGRAGVALGALPSIVTVTGEDSAAKIAGLTTGDRIDAVAPSSGEVAAIPVRAFPEVLEHIDQALAASRPTLELQVRRPKWPTVETSETKGAPSGEPSKDPESQGTDSVEASRTVSLPLSAAQGLSGRAAALALGLTDSQLTVSEAIDTVANVLKPGDRLVALDGKPIPDVYALREQLMVQNKPEAMLEVERNFRLRPIPINLKGVEAQKPEGVATIYTLPVLFLGQPVDPDPLVEKYTNPFSALAYGIAETARQTAELCGNLKSLFTGEIPVRALGGPMLIAKVAGDSARRGWQTFLSSMALISINLGLINLFPIPVLDGGQLTLMGVEGLRRRPLRAGAIENFQKIGFALVLALVVLATYNDVRRFWRSMLESVAGLFQ